MRLHGYRPGPADPGWPCLQGTATGRWTGGGIDDATFARGVGGWPAHEPAWTVPPGPPPPGGWPPGGEADVHRPELDAMSDDGNIATRIHYHPRPDTVVLVVAATDVAAAEARWRPLAGDRLCVVASRWSRSELDAVCGALHAASDRWATFGLSRPADARAQRHVCVELLRVTPELAGWAAGLPEGILEVRPALVPAPVGS